MTGILVFLSKYFIKILLVKINHVQRLVFCKASDKDPKTLVLWYLLLVILEWSLLISKLCFQKRD